MIIPVKKMVPLVFAMFFLAACGGNGSNEEATPLTKDEFAFTAVNTFSDYDYSNQTPDGTSDSDSDGKIDVNDAVIVIETLKQMGYPVEATTVSGLYENYFTNDGYAYEDTPGAASKEAFSYTLGHSATEADLKNGEWSLLSPGDLIFVDFDKDFVWDNAAIYLGDYAEYAHAAFFASDYYDETRILDLDTPDNILALDIEYGYSGVRQLDITTLSGKR